MANTIAREVLTWRCRSRMPKTTGKTKNFASLPFLYG